MISLATFTVDAIHSLLRENAGKRRMKVPTGHDIRVDSHRLVLFSTKGVCCSACGIEGVFYSLDTFRAGIKPHLNLYAIDHESGKIVLMTKDHTLPKSKGGKNVMENYTTMCSPCNGAKGNKLPD